MCGINVCMLFNIYWTYFLFSIQISGSSHCLQQSTTVTTKESPNSQPMPLSRATPPKPPIPSPEAAPSPPTEIEREETPTIKTPSTTTPQRKAMISSNRQLSTSTNSGRKNVLGTLPHHHLSVDELRLMQVV